MLSGWGWVVVVVVGSLFFSFDGRGVGWRGTVMKNSFYVIFNPEQLYKRPLP